MNKLMAVVVVALGCVASLVAEEEAEAVKIGGAGKISFVNAAGVDDKLLGAAAGRVRTILLLETEIRKGEWHLASARKDFEGTGAAIAVFVVKEPNMPMSLIALEEKWGMVNASLLEGNRITKEVVRVATVLLGGASSKYKASAMRPAFSPADLDNVGELVTIDSIMAIYPNLKSLGLKQYKIMGYDEALDAGIAPEPVNDKQRQMKAEFEKARAAKKK